MEFFHICVGDGVKYSYLVVGGGGGGVRMRLSSKLFGMCRWIG